MSVDDLRAWLVAACDRLAQARDELTELDAAAGDGDLGITVSSGARGVATALRELPDQSSAADLFTAAGAAFARGNPSSFAALTGAGLLAAAGEVNGTGSLARDAVVAAVTAATERIAERGRAFTGERTVLDALVPSIVALKAAPPGVNAALEEMVRAARAGVEATKDMTPLRGRAAWIGERSHGVPDAGATAYLRFLEALLDTRT